MRTIPGYPDPKRLIQQPVGRVMLDNQWQEVRSIDLVQSLGTGLPAQIAGVDGMVAATGAVTIKNPGLPGAVVTGFNLPWGVAPGVRAGQGVNLELGDAGAYGRVLTGRVDGVDGSAASDGLTFTVTDRIDRLAREVSIPPLSERHPSTEGFDHMRIGLHPTFRVNWVARHSGFHATPPLHDDAVVSAPMIGSSWPERGTVVQATGFPISNAYPAQRSAPWGLATTNVNALYRPNLDFATGILNIPAFFHFLAAPPFVESQSNVRIEWPSGDYLVVIFEAESESEQVIWIEHRDASHTPQSGMSFLLDGAGIGPEGVEVEAWIEPPSVAENAAGIWLSMNGVRQTNAFNTLWLTEEMTTTPASGVRIVADSTTGMGIGGVQVGFATARRPLSEASGAWERTAIIETDHAMAIQNVRSQVKANALELLKTQASEELSAMWIDGLGRFRYRSRDRLLNAASSFELDFNDIAGIDWTISRTAAMRKLTVKWVAPRTWRSTEPRIDLWQGTGGTIEDGDEYEDPNIHPDADVDWINVDPISELDNTGPLLWRFNHGYGSWVSGILLDQDNPDESQQELPAGPSHYNTGYARLDHRSYLIRVQPIGLNGRQMVLKAPSYPTMPAVRQGIDTPILRGQGLVQYPEQETVIFDRTGPEYRDLPEYVHEAGDSIQTEAAALALGATLAADVTEPRPVLSTVAMAKFDDRRELADVCTVRTPQGYPDLRCLVVKDENSLTSKSNIKRTQTLALQVIDELPEEEAA